MNPSLKPLKTVNHAEQGSLLNQDDSCNKFGITNNKRNIFDGYLLLKKAGNVSSTWVEIQGFV